MWMQTKDWDICSAKADQYYSFIQDVSTDQDLELWDSAVLLTVSFELHRLNPDTRGINENLTAKYRGINFRCSFHFRIKNNVF